MKNYLKFIILATFTFILFSCSDDEPSSAYYVKYEASVKSVYIGDNIKYTVKTENGFKTYTSGKSYSQTFGPVKKGFNAKITADARDWNIADCEVKIYVCRGEEPFALKSSNSGGKLVSTSYTIDY